MSATSPDRARYNAARTHRSPLVVVGAVLLAIGIVLGTRPVAATDAQREAGYTYQGRRGQEVTIVTVPDRATSPSSTGDTTCGSTFVPRRCEPGGSLVWLTGLFVIAGAATLAAGGAQIVSGRRDRRDRWSAADALLLVGAPVLVVGTIVVLVTYNVAMYRRFDLDP